MPADDLKRMEKLYSSVFGWNANSVQGMNYVLESTTEVDKNGRPTKPGAIN